MACPLQRVVRLKLQQEFTEKTLDNPKPHRNAKKHEKNNRSSAINCNGGLGSQFCWIWDLNPSVQL